MITVEMKGLREFDGALHRLSTGAREEVAKALTNCITYDLKPKVIEGMRSAFDRPTRWTLGGTFTEAATAAKLEANLHFKNRAAGGVPAGRWLRAQVFGGSRSLKSHEKKLAAIGLLPGDLRLLPAMGAALDAHGNMRPSQIKAIMTALLRDPPKTRRRKRPGAEASAKLRYFAVLPGQSGSHLAPGIYAAFGSGVGRSVLPVLVFGRNVAYRERLDFVGIAQEAIAKGLPRRLDRAMKRILALPGGFA